VEIDAHGLLKGTHGGADGVYDADPRTHPDARRFDEVSFDEVIAKGLRAMDLTAITLCKENGLPIKVFSIMEPGNIRRAIRGDEIGTLIR
jgi:uridylate kinase